MKLAQGLHLDLMYNSCSVRISNASLSLLGQHLELFFYNYAFTPVYSVEIFSMHVRHAIFIIHFFD